MSAEGMKGCRLVTRDDGRMPPWVALLDAEGREVPGVQRIVLDLSPGNLPTAQVTVLVEAIDVKRLTALWTARILDGEGAGKPVGVTSSPTTERERAEAAYGPHDAACRDDREAFVAGWEARAKSKGSTS